MKGIHEVKEGIVVDIEVSPRSSHFSIRSYNQWRNRIEIQIRSVPEKGKANQEIIQEFSRLTNKEVEIVSGHKSRKKTIKVYDISEKEFSQIINDILK